MKTLYIVRHAKSSWEHPHLSDHDRPLLKKGKKRTKLIGQFLVRNRIAIDLMISSSAVRAYETAKIIARSIGYPVEYIQVNSNVYHTNVDSLVNGLYALPDDVQSVMYFGHNPTFTYFANEWLDEKIDWLPTSGLAGISFETDMWKDLATAKYRTDIYITPRMLKSMKKE